MDAEHIARIMVMHAINSLGESGREHGGTGMDAVLADGIVYMSLDGQQYRITVEPVTA